MIGQTISHYKILEKLGEGGMGIVYKAQDTKLNRTVALKFLPEHISASEADTARFMQEAQAAASLNHPNICTIHGIEEADKKNFIVMEFVDGQMLQEKKSSLSMKQALDIGIQIAEGLSAAHEKGIVHRDIKPENIMIRKDGRVQIMDFGLAKLRGASRLTKEGSTVGTAGYMSPEQVQGQETDHRSDIFSLGVLLYEMLSGQPPFKGIHETAISYEIVNVDSRPLSSIKSEIPPELDGIVLECLQKDPNERAQSSKQVAIDLKRYKRESSRERVSHVTSAQPAMRTSGIGRPEISQTEMSDRNEWTRKTPWIVSTFCFIGMMAFALLYLFEPSADRTVVRSSLLPPEKAGYSSLYGGGHFAISADGSKLAFVAIDSTGRSRLWVRAMNSFTSLPLPGTEGAAFPFWSPDNRFIGFFSGSKLRKIEAVGGPPTAICDAPDGRGGTWNKDGVIVFAPNWIGGLYQVPSAGGSPTLITALDTTHREQTHRWPTFLPDGEHILYYARSSAGGTEADADAIKITSIDGTGNKRLFSASSNVEYASGHILFVRQSVVMAMPFDASSLTASGEAIPIAEQVGYEVNFNRGHFAVSNNGIFVYQTGSSTSGIQMTWVDRTGKTLRKVGEPALFGGGQLSPDGKRLAVSVFEPQSRNRDIWVYDLARDVRTRFTFDPGVEEYPVWSPDGTRLMYASDKKGHLDIYQKAVGGEGSEELLVESTLDKYPTDCSFDGRFLLYYTSGDPIAKSNLWSLPLKGDRTPVPLYQAEFEEQDATFAPNGKWIAYTSTESGRPAVYVRPFPGPGGKWQISTSGLNLGTLIVASRWNRNGRELYYLSEDQRVMVAEVNGSGSSFEVGAVRALFDGRADRTMFIQAVSADGQRFLMATAAGQSYIPLTLVLNWDEELNTK
ncbi:MAG: protein kinase [Bacteroidota bacterium]